MLWEDEGFVLAARRHGESSLIVSALTRDHGRHLGLVRGGASRRSRPVYQLGNLVALTWRARLVEQLGTFSGELQLATGTRFLADPGRLAALTAACVLIDATLPERDPHGRIFNQLADLLQKLVQDDAWPEAYVQFELALLADLGFGLDLTACAVTGTTDDLIYVSPASGRAVSGAGAGRYADRLLPLPAFLVAAGAADPGQLRAGLRLTGAFLRRHLFDASERAMPPARERLVARFARFE